ncbi:MAG: glutaredoxin family protein [Elusimicrobiota bacterium]
MEVEHVSGKDKGKIMLYALSTCVWCRKTKKLLDKLGLEYSYIYLDLLEGKEKENTREELKKWNPKCSFPTLVINNRECIVGFKEDEIKEAIGA